jgi:putative ABC transport system permease protein
MVLRQGAGMACIGIVIGVAAAAVLTRAMTSLLYDVRPTDWQTFLIAAIGLMVTALAASLLPALRAARIDPADAVR